MVNIFSAIFPVSLLIILSISVTRSFPVKNASPGAGPVVDALAVGGPKGIGEFKRLKSKNGKNEVKEN